MKIGPGDRIEPNRLYTVEELAPVLRVAVKTLRRYCSNGLFPSAFKVAGGRWLIPGADVTALGRCSPGSDLTP